MRFATYALTLFLVFSSIVACAQSDAIHNVIVVFQENRTPDNLFHGLRGADIANSGIDSSGRQITLGPVDLAVNYTLSHSHPSFLAMYDHGRMDGADRIHVRCVNKKDNCLPSNPQFKYVRSSDVAPYMQMAQQYTFADRMFQTNQGPSFPAHQFIIAGTSAPTADSDLFASENTIEPGHSPAPAGCSAPSNTYVPLIDPSGDESQNQYPCFEHQTLMDLLDNQGISWRYYTQSAVSIWTSPNAIQHLRFGPDWQSVVLKPSQILTDISQGKLAAVSWVMPTGPESDHAGSTDGSGPSWVASIVNAVGKSQYWDHTAILITWDDWGGWYDHVAPPIANSYEYGFRVPLIVVSPYAKRGYVSHTNHDFGSILKFIEGVFGLPSLGYADARADDLSDCFDFHHRHSPGAKFRPISAPLGPEFFIHDSRPLTDPDDD